VSGSETGVADLPEISISLDIMEARVIGWLLAVEYTETCVPGERGEAYEDLPEADEAVAYLAIELGGTDEYSVGDRCDGAIT